MSNEYRGYKGYTGYSAPKPEAGRDWASYAREARQHPADSAEYNRLFDLADQAAWHDKTEAEKVAAFVAVQDEVAADPDSYERSLQRRGL